MAVKQVHHVTEGPVRVSQCVCLFTEISAPQPVFGMALGSHLERSCRDIASVLEECVTALMDYGLEEEV